MLVKLSIILIYLFSSQIASSKSLLVLRKKIFVLKKKQRSTNECLIHCILDGIYETDSINEKVINNQTFPYLKETF